MEPETKNFKIIAMVRKTKSHAQLRNEIDELEAKQAYLLAKNHELQDHLNKASATAEALRQEIKNIKNKTPKWHYGLAFFGFAVGTALCASGIGLLPGALVLGVTSLILGSMIILSDACFIGYNIYRQCERIPNVSPSSHAPAIKTTTQAIPLPHPTPPSENHILISTKPLFSPRSRDVPDKKPEEQQTNPHVPSPTG